MSTTLRIDKLLWFLRLAKSRSLAQSIIAEGRVRLDGERVLTTSRPVSINQVITLAVHDRVRAIRISAIPTRRGPAPEAQSCYFDLTSNQIIDAKPD